MAAEKQFEEKVKAFLKEQGCYILKYWGGAAFTKAGVPDLLVCFNGLFIGIELKAERGEPSLLQLHHLKRIRDAEGFGLLLYPEDFLQFRRWLHHMSRDAPWYDDNIEKQKQWKIKLEERNR